MHIGMHIALYWQLSYWHAFFLNWQIFCRCFIIENGRKCFVISRKVKTQIKHTKKIFAMYGEGSLSDQTCQKWFAKFHAGNFSLDDAPQSGRPTEVDSNQIETLIENNQHYTM